MYLGDLRTLTVKDIFLLYLIQVYLSWNRGITIIVNGEIALDV